MWPTPHANCHTGAGIKGEGGPNLQTAVKMWATPTVKGDYNRAGLSSKSGDGLATQVGGALNPTWVEWLMGFPAGWTALDASVMPSSRKSPKLSGAQS
jgi:hypothetical protein